MFNKISWKNILILGFAFKADTGDTRESPAIKICKELYAEKADLVISDPKAISNAKKDLSSLDNVIFEKDPYEAAKDADAIALLTDWKFYNDLDFEKLHSVMRKPAFIFDGRNILDHEKIFNLGFEVYSVGKGHLTHLD